MEISKEAIIENLNNPEILEGMYQLNKKEFSDFIKILHDQDKSIIIQYWYVRLFYKPLNKRIDTFKYIFTAMLVIITWIPIRLSFELNFNEHLLNAIPVVFFLALSLFFMADNSIKIKKVLLAILPYIVIYIYSILLTNTYLQKNCAFDNLQVLDNAYYFAFILLWFFVLFARSNCSLKNLDYVGLIEKTGEAIIWSTMFIIGGGIIVWLSLALFNAIKIDAWEFYYKNIATLGLAAAPFVSLLVIEQSKKSKLSVIIANIFLPLILLSLAVFGIISIFTESRPYENRDIFISYNIMMVIVICVLIFTGINPINNKFIKICSNILPGLTIVLDIITISAVIYRLDKYGISPNKITLLGINIIMLGHLIFIVYLKFKNRAEKILSYLPVYFIYALVVVFIMPFVFTW